MNGTLTRRSVLRRGSLLAAMVAIPGLAACRPESSASDGAISYLNASTGQEPVLEELNARYRDEAAVRIRVETIAQDYDQALRARAQAREMPDLYYPTLGGTLNDHAPYVDGGWPLDLTDVMDDGWRDSFSPELLAYTTYAAENRWGVEPGIYSVPFDGNCWMMLCNHDLWRQADLDPEEPPATWDEFVSALRQLRNVTDQPFGMNPGQTYGPEAFALTFGSNLLGVDTVVATTAGEHPWTSAEWRTVLELLQELRDADVLAPGSTTWQMPDVEQAFFAQKNLATAFGFSSSIPVGQSLDAEFDGFGAFLPPPPTSAEMRIQGGKSKSVAINARSPRVEEIVEYLRWFTAPEQQRHYARALPTIPVNPAVMSSPDDLDPRITPFAEHMDRIMPPEAALLTPVADALSRGVQQLLVGDNDAAGILTNVQAAQDEG
ncbi:ABC transporter substrate-binding protein [Georgenia alba]|uniref:ABC transporter substrate-binding protein n=1 Tax=Georgenia alba TaxID=2233858 RepID=A0ABW2Q4F1_9MICO